MTSPLFKNKNNLNNCEADVLPILLDQIVFKQPIKTEEEYFRNPDAPKQPLFKLLEHEVVNYFSDPRIYFRRRFNLALPLGKEVLLTGGARLYRASRGEPQPHYVVRKRSPKETLLERYEKIENQLTDEELTDICRRSTDPLNPYVDSILLAVQKVAEALKAVISQEKLGGHNPTFDHVPRKALSRLELYFEIPVGQADRESAKSAVTQAIKIALGHQKFAKGKVNWRDDLATAEYARWELPQSLLSPVLRGQKKALIKVYDKGHRIRVEIQLNNPVRRRGPHQELEDTLKGLDLGHEAVEIANLAAVSLRSIERSARKILAELPDRPTVDARADQILLRCSQFTRRTKDINFIKMIRFIAENGWIDKKTCKSLGVDPQALIPMSDPHYGFLRHQPKTLAPENLALSNRRRIRDGIYILVNEWVSRTEKPLSKQPRSRSCFKSTLANFTANPSLQHQVSPQLIFQATGSAASSSLLSSLAGRINSVVHPTICLGPRYQAWFPRL